MEVSLIRVTKNGTTTPVPLREGRTLVGRLDDCQIRVPVAGISRKHCEIVIDGGSIVINDLGSSNGTFVNQDRVSSEPLSAGDLISFGGLVFVVNVNGEPGDIDAELMFEDGLPDEEPASPVSSAQATPKAKAPAKATSSQADELTIPPSMLDDSDESSMMDFEFDFDDDDDQPPL